VSSYQRRKGAAGELELAALLTEQLGRVVKRNLGQARDSGDDITIERFRIEAKRCQVLKVPAWCRQVEAAAKPGEIPVVAFRRNGEPWRVIVTLDDFLPLMRGELSPLATEPESA
jgi:hypothetical protein